MEEGEQRRGEEMGLTVKQRQAIMNELRGKYAHASKKEKSRILDEFVDQSASQPFIRTQHPEGKGGAGKGSRPSSQGIGVQGGRSSLRSRSSGIFRTGSVASVSSRSCSASSLSSRQGGN